MDKASKKLLEQSKSKNPDVKTVKERSKTYLFAASVDNRKENGVRVSTNRKEDLCGDNLESEVVPVVENKVVEAEIQVKSGDYIENVQESDYFNNSENEVAGDNDTGTNDGISLLVDVSNEMGREDSGDSNERQNDGTFNGNRENPHRKIGDVSDCKYGEEEDSSDGEYEFCVGDFVWGKIKSYPWWPGQIYDSSDASDYALKMKHRDRLLVAYFDGTFAWCRPTQLKPFEKNFEEMSRQSSSKSFVDAVQKAVDEIGRLVELNMTCPCVPKESLIGLARPLAMNSGIRPGVLLPEGGISKLSNYLFGPAECLAELKHVALDVSINSMLEFIELKCWLSAFYRAKGRYRLALYHEPQSIPGLEDKDQDTVFDLSCDAEFPIQGPVEEETNQSLLQKCGHNQRRKQKSIAEIMEGYVNTQTKNVEEDLMKVVTGLENLMMLSSMKKRKINDEANVTNNLSHKPKRRRVTKLLQNTLATGSEIPSVERSGSKAMEEKQNVLLSREKKIKNKGSQIENDGQGKKETNTSCGSVERKKFARDGGEAKEQIEKGFLIRERKKSKYLSPPYTSINRMKKTDIDAEIMTVSREARLAERTNADSVKLNGSESSPFLMCQDEVLKKKDAGEEHETSYNSITETLKLDENTTIDSKMVKASANEVLSGIRSMAIDLNSLEKKNSVDLVGGFVLIFRSSVYCNGCNNKKRKTLDSESWLSAKYQNQSDRKSSNQRSQRTRIKMNDKSKMMKYDEGKLGKPVCEQATRTTDMKPKDRRTEGQEKSDKHKLKQAAGPQDKKKKDTETDGKAAPDINANDEETAEKASPTSLFVTFGPGSSLPSKDDLIEIYSKFGSLNEEETEMFYNNYCARVVFLRSSDAEEAFKSSQLTSQFGAANANFQLRNSSSTSKIRKLKEIPNAKPSPPKKRGKTLEKESASKSSIGGASPYNFVKLKLEMIASVLENSGGEMSLELKSKLQGDVKDLLEKVKTVEGSSSS